MHLISWEKALSLWINHQSFCFGKLIDAVFAVDGGHNTLDILKKFRDRMNARSVT
jgi:hypothetical protein